jgi:signal transduction histidine kinase
MFDRLSSLVIALTLVVIAAILASLAGGDALTIAIMLLAGFTAAATVYSALPLPLPDTQGAPAAEAPPASLLRHPDFAHWVDQEKEPLLGVADNIVSIANDAAVRLLGRHIVGADVRTAIRHPAATEWLARLADDAPVEPINLVDFPRPGQRWTMRVAALSGTEHIILLSDRSAIDAADRMRSDFVANASHELRTPLAAITGASTLLLDAAVVDPAVRRELVATVVEEAERLERLVSDLLDMTRLDSGVVEPRREWVPLVEVVGAAMNRMERALGTRPVAITIPDDLPLLSIDPILVEQLLVNLLENATKYTPPGSEISVAAAREGGTLVLDVADRGPGLPAGEEERIFERFHRAARPGVRGVGLGLPIARAIAQAHGGRLTAASRPGGGSVFRLTLPVAAPPAPPPEPAPPHGGPA